MTGAEGGGKAVDQAVLERDEMVERLRGRYVCTSG